MAAPRLMSHADMGSVRSTASLASSLDTALVRFDTPWRDVVPPYPEAMSACVVARTAGRYRKPGAKAVT